MGNYTFTNRPDLFAGIYGHHLLTQATIDSSEMLKSMHATNILNFADYNFNGVALSGSITDALQSQSAVHVLGSTHPDLQNFLQNSMIAPLSGSWDQRVTDLRNQGYSLLDARNMANSEFVGDIRGKVGVLYTSVNPLVNSTGDFIDFNGNVLTLQ